MPLSRDPLTLDQIKTFLVVADAGSFSEAARRTGRAQSAVSFIIASLEETLGVSLFERSARGLTVTSAAAALMPRALAMVQASSAFRRLASDLAAEAEIEVTLGVDVLFPLSVVSVALRAFEQSHPQVSVRLNVEPLGGVAQLVMDRRCALGIIGSLPDYPPELVGERLGSVNIAAVTAPEHPLAGHAVWPDELLREHCQIVVSDRTKLSEGRDFAVFADRTLRTSDLAAKRVMLLEGLGWGAMPLHLVESDLSEGRLIRIEPDAWHGAPLRLPFQLIRHSTNAIGPATTYLAKLLQSGKIGE